MSLLTVDQDKCIRDGLCVSICPLGLIEQKGPKVAPAPKNEAEGFCVECGHCVAVCPKGALSHRSIPVEKCLPYDYDLRLFPEHVEHFLRARRSIRSYTDQKVDRPVIEKLIDIARYAPSGHNFQPVNWHVIYEPATVKSMAAIVIDWCRYLIKKQSPFAEAMHMARVVAAWDSGKEIICQGAPHVIVAYGHEKDGTAATSCTIALTFLELATAAFGLGACWAGFFSLAANVWPPMKEALNLPEKNIAYGAMMIGHPKVKYYRMPLRKDPTITWG